MNILRFLVRLWPWRKAARHLLTGTCPYCGEEGIYLRLDRQPHGRYHRCVEMRRTLSSGVFVTIPGPGNAEPNPTIPTNAA